jgi:hypothetical protein
LLRGVLLLVLSQDGQEEILVVLIDEPPVPPVRSARCLLEVIGESAAVSDGESLVYV